LLFLFVLLHIVFYREPRHQYQCPFFPFFL
jgi:hypothetical protein